MSIVERVQDVGGQDSLAARSAILRLPSHSMRLCRRSLNFAHVPVVYAGHLPIVPGDRDGIPTCFGDNAAIGGIASPINPGTLPQALRFGDCHSCPSVVCADALYGTKLSLSFHFTSRYDV